MKRINCLVCLFETADLQSYRGLFLEICHQCSFPLGHLRSGPWPNSDLSLVIGIYFVDECCLLVSFIAENSFYPSKMTCVTSLDSPIFHFPIYLIPWLTF